MDKFFTKTDEQGNEYIYMRAEDLVWSIPADPANSDYQRYLRWLEDPEAEENGTIS